MKKFLRFLFIFIGVLVVAVVIISFVVPDELNVSRSMAMKAPSSVVFNQVTDFKNWKSWSPWYEMDTNMTITYYGNAGEEGSGYHWVGTKEGKTGVGDMKNTGITGDTMNFLVSFKEPWESEANGKLAVHDNGDGTTQATWMFKCKMNPMSKVFSVFANMDKMLGKDFERGLTKLKEYTEAHATEAPATATTGVTTTAFPGHTYAIIRQKVDWANMDTFFKNSYAKLGKVAGASVTGYPSAIYYEWNEGAKYADLAAAMPVKDDFKPTGGIAIEKVPAAVSYQYVLKGSYNGMTAAHGAIGQKIKEEGAQTAWVIEEYITNDFNEKDTAKWVTNIIYLKK